MDNADFKDFCTSVRQTWTRQEGVVLKLKTSTYGRKTWRLCAGNHRNDGLAARKVVLWDGEDILYDGPLMARALQHILTRKGICCGELTTVKQLNKKAKGVFKCFKGPNTTCPKSCKLKHVPVVQVAPGLSVSVL